MNAMIPDPQLDSQPAIPLPAAAHRRAESYSATQANPQRSKQRYLDSLAIYAVDFYMDCLGLEPDWTASDSHDPLFLQLSPVADLVIPSLGRLECCALLPDQQRIEVSPDAWGDRIAYMVVQLESSLNEAKLLGFVREVAAEQGEILVSALQPMTEFPHYLSSLGFPGSTNPSPWIQLETWFKHHFTSGWQALENHLDNALLNTAGPATPRFAFRGAVTENVKKTLCLGSDDDLTTLDLLLRLTRKSDNRLRIEPRLLSPQGNLPSGLSLSVIDEQQKTFLTMTATGQETALSLQAFLGKPGERFSLAVNLRDHYIQEHFQI